MLKPIRSLAVRKLNREKNGIQKVSRKSAGTANRGDPCGNTFDSYL